MTTLKDAELVPYEIVSPGFEAIYSGEPDEAGDERDAGGQGITQWPLWTWTGVEMTWGEEIAAINKMQARLGPLDEATRKIRAHIGSLAHCDSGFPVTVDELLSAIGRGKLNDQLFHNGCFWSFGPRETQPGQVESMRTIEAVLRAYLAGAPQEDMLETYPHASGFIQRTYAWLGRRTELTQIQVLLLERILLPFPFLTRRTPDQEAVYKDCFAAGGAGTDLDKQISALAGLPEIYPNYEQQYRANLAGLTDPEQRALYKLCGTIAHGLHGLSDCHHSTFRWLENWLYGIGTGQWLIPTRKEGTERERLGRLMFAYVLGLDQWLAGTPMQFLLLDLGHSELGFDPKNEILRVYAHLGAEKTPLKEWLAACLWYQLYFSLRRQNIHQALLDRATEAGIILRQWLDKTQKKE